MVPEDYNVYEMSRKEISNYLAVMFSVLFIYGYVYFSGIAIPLIIGSMSVAGLGFYRNMMAEKRKSELRIQFRDLLYSVASSVTSGRHLAEAIEDAGRAVELIYGSESLMAAEIKHMVNMMKETNCSEETALEDFAGRTHIQEISDFAEICIMCRKTGGNLEKMIYKAAESLCSTMDLKREKEVLLSQKKLEARILAVMPMAVTGLVKIFSADYLQSMYTTSSGRAVMTVAFILNVVSFIWCIKITDADRFMSA